MVVRRLVEMIGHGRSGTIAVDLHVGDVVDEPRTTLGHRIPLPRNDIGLGFRCWSRRCRCGSRRSSAAAARRSGRPRPGRPAGPPAVVLAEDVEQPDCDHDDHNDCQRTEERRHRRPVGGRSSSAVRPPEFAQRRRHPPHPVPRDVTSGAVASATPSRRRPSVSSGRSNSRTSLSATANASPTTRRSTSLSPVPTRRLRR